MFSRESERSYTINVKISLVNDVQFATIIMSHEDGTVFYQQYKKLDMDNAGMYLHMISPAGHSIIPNLPTIDRHCKAAELQQDQIAEMFLRVLNSGAALDATAQSNPAARGEASPGAQALVGQKLGEGAGPTPPDSGRQDQVPRPTGQPTAPHAAPSAIPSE